MSQIKDKQISVYIKNEMKLTIEVQDYDLKAILFTRDEQKHIVFIESLSAIVFPDDVRDNIMDQQSTNNVVADFLSDLLSEGKIISVYMSHTRRRISGTICSFNDISVTLQHLPSNEKQTIFFSAISTISPYINRPMNSDKEYQRLNYRNHGKQDSYYSKKGRL